MEMLPCNFLLIHETYPHTSLWKYPSFFRLLSIRIYGGPEMIYLPEFLLRVLYIYFKCYVYNCIRSPCSYTCNGLHSDTTIGEQCSNSLLLNCLCQTTSRKVFFLSSYPAHKKSFSALCIYSEINVKGLSIIYPHRESVKLTSQAVMDCIACVEFTQ